MPLLDVTNPEIIRYLSENYEKAEWLRMKWNILHADILKVAATHKKEGRYSTYDVLKTTLRAGLPTIIRDHATAANYRRRTPIRDADIPGVADLKKKHTIVNIGLGDPKDDPRLDRPHTDTTFDPLMRVVKPVHQNIIYKDLPYFGRAVYLKNRRRILPEDKYYFPECSSWDYGWRLKDSELSKKGATRGRVWRLTHEGENRTGSQPDPAYYNKCNILTYSRCGVSKLL